MKRKFIRLKLLAVLAAVMFCGTTVFGQTVTGSGTTSYVPRWSNGGSSIIGNGIIQDDGSNVGVGKAPNASYKLDVNGNINISSGNAYKYNGNTILKEDFSQKNIYLDNGDHSGITGDSNVFVGRNAGNSNTSGRDNVFVGVNAGRNNTSGYGNGFMGSEAGRYNTTGYYNYFMGYRAGKGNTTGTYNVFLGEEAGINNTTGNGNLFLGRSAGRTNTKGGLNVFIGDGAGYKCDTSYNVFIGGSAGDSTTKGSSDVYIGYAAGYNNKISANNTFVGYMAGKNVVTGNSNVLLGYKSGYDATGASNVFLGVESGKDNTGNYNTFVGMQAGISSSSGANNTSLGYQAGHSATGSSNVLLGYLAGYYETGSNKLFISNNAYTNETTDRTRALLYGQFYSSGNPFLQINGDLYPKKDVYDINNSAGSNGQVLSSKGGSGAGVEWVSKTSLNDLDWQVNGNDVYTGHGTGGYPSGNVGIGTTSPYAKLGVETTNDIAISAKTTSTNESNMAIYAESSGSSPINNSIYADVRNGSTNYAGWFSSGGGVSELSNTGVHALASSATTNFGVDAEASYGTESYGVSCVAHQATTNYGIMASAWGGTTNYAGYFDGDVHVVGSGTYTGTWTQSSDKKLKKNIKPLEGSMEKIMNLKPRTYNYRTDEFPQMRLPEGECMGFVAQELEEVLPDLVVESKQPASLDKKGNKIGEDIDYKSVNYISIIPLLVGGMQEQQKTIEEQKSEISELKSQITQLEAGISQLGNNSSINNETIINSAKLYQNNPNPFTNQTEIGYYLPVNTVNASLLVFDMTGKQMKSYTLASKGNGKLIINGGELEAGMYLYSLITDGKEIDTKRMILTNN